MNPFTFPIEAQRRTLEMATDAVDRSRVAPDRTETIATVDVGETPSEVVYEENKLELHRYDPETVGAEKEHDVPILVVYALINRPYILDLQEERSVIRRLLENGFEVYMIDWGEPSQLDASLTLDDYVNRYIDNCVDVVAERAGVDAVNVLGYCMGGTMSVMYAALHPEKVRNLGLMAAGLCFAGTGGVLEMWGSDEYFDPGKVVDTFGNVPADFLDVGFALMDPVNNYVAKYVNLYENMEDEDFVENFARMERWLDDGIDVAGEAYREFLEDVYQENALYENELEVGGEHVDLNEIDMPVLQVIGEYDHLIPPEASKPFNDRIPSDDVTTMEFATGHIGLSVSSSSHADLWPQVAEWYADRSAVGLDESEAVEVDVESPTEEADETAGAAAVDEATEAAEEPTEAAEEPTEADDLQSLSGIGPAYAEQLRDAGVTSVADLAAADPVELAGPTDIGEGRLRTLVRRAAERVDE